MKQAVAILLFSLCLFAFFDSGFGETMNPTPTSGFSCYRCEMLNNPDCKKVPPSKNNLKVCDDGAKHCETTKDHRSCVPETMTSSCKLPDCKLCSSSGCNDD